MAEFATTGFVAFVHSHWGDGEGLDVIEVGGGRRTHVPLPKARFTVLEDSPAALLQTDYAAERLQGDAQTFDYGSRAFDIAVFWNVLEHIPEPLMALRAVLPTLQEGGMLVVRGPDPRALKSIVTRLTPHWLHVQFYRHVLGSKLAGTPGRSPFKVEHAPGAYPDRIGSFLDQEGLVCAYREAYVGDQVQSLQRYSGLAFALYRGVSMLLRAATGGRWGVDASEFVLVFARRS